MTVREVAAALNVSDRTIRRHAEKLGMTRNGIATYLSEADATKIKQAIERSGRNDLDNVVQVRDTTTDAEMMEQAANVMRWLRTKVQEERAGRLEAERRNAVLMHVSRTYTATEVAKEVGLRSAQELNKFLAERGIQYCVNGSWVPYADYADRGYFELKQDILDNGHVVYHRKITQDGRAFILSLFGLVKQGE